MPILKGCANRTEHDDSTHSLSWSSQYGIANTSQQLGHPMGIETTQRWHFMDTQHNDQTC